jgi:hypothetical protein
MALSTGQFGMYHGTSAWMKPGETLNPGTDGVYDHAGVPAEHRQAGAYASTDQGEAQSYAENSVRNKPGQGELFAPVYPVENVSEHSDPMGKLADSFPSYRRDTAGFRVTGPPSSIVPNPAALPPVSLSALTSPWE